MEYTLKITEAQNKAGRYHYQVIDQAGNVISERKSNRQYVACTINGQFYFGRLDLIGKGEHGKQLQLNRKHGRQDQPIAYLEQKPERDPSGHYEKREGELRSPKQDECICKTTKEAEECDRQCGCMGQ